MASHLPPGYAGASRPTPPLGADFRGVKALESAEQLAVSVTKSIGVVATALTAFGLVTASSLAETDATSNLALCSVGFAILAIILSLVAVVRWPRRVVATDEAIKKVIDAAAGWKARVAAVSVLSLIVSLVFAALAVLWLVIANDPSQRPELRLWTALEGTDVAVHASYEVEDFATSDAVVMTLSGIRGDDKVVLERASAVAGADGDLALDLTSVGVGSFERVQVGVAVGGGDPTHVRELEIPDRLRGIPAFSAVVSRSNPGAGLVVALGATGLEPFQEVELSASGSTSGTGPGLSLWNAVVIADVTGSVTRDVELSGIGRYSLIRLEAVAGETHFKKELAVPSAPVPEPQMVLRVQRSNDGKRVATYDVKVSDLQPGALVEGWIEATMAGDSWDLVDWSARAGADGELVTNDVVDATEIVGGTLTLHVVVSSGDEDYEFAQVVEL